MYLPAEEKKKTLDINHQTNSTALLNKINATQRNEDVTWTLLSYDRISFHYNHRWRRKREKKTEGI